jgi:PAS domain S-box-containing protein
VGATDFFVKSHAVEPAGRPPALPAARRAPGIELERSKSKLARAQDLARMGSFDWRAVATRTPRAGLTLSPESLRVFGFGPQDRVSLRRLLRMVPLPERRGMMRVLHEVQAQPHRAGHRRARHAADGRMRIMHVEAEPEFNEHGHGAGYTGIVQDVTDRRVAEDRIRHLANFDALTGLPNRRQLIWRAERALEQARRLGTRLRCC